MRIYSQTPDVDARAIANPCTIQARVGVSSLRAQGGGGTDCLSAIKTHAQSSAQHDKAT